MTAYTLAGSGTIRDIGNSAIFGTATGRTGGDTYDLNGWNLTWDQDSRYGIGGTTSTSIGGVTINATKGGNITFDGRYVRLIPFTSGSGSITANASVSLSGATGNVIGIYSAVTSAPVLTGVASGFLKITNWNGVAFPTSGTLTVGSWSGTINGADTAGWIEVVGDDAGVMTCNRLGTFQARGAWYEFAGTTTSGTRTTGYQVPTNGSLTHIPGVMVQSASATITAAVYSAGSVIYTAAGHGFNKGQEVTITGASPSGFNCADVAITAATADTFTVTLADPGSAWSSGGSASVFDFYPSAGSKTALVTSIATDAIRGRWCWYTTGGLLYFGYDGTNSTGGYCPPSGRKLRIQNVMFQCCTTAARTANVLPNAGLSTRMDFNTSGGGVVVMDKVLSCWYLYFSQPYSVSLSHVSTFESLTLSECASAIAWENVGVGQTNTANSQIAATLMLNFAGGALRNCTWTRISQANTAYYVVQIADCADFEIVNNRLISLTKAWNVGAGSAILTRLVNSSLTNCVLGGGRVLQTGCDTVTWTNTRYFDTVAGTTDTAVAFYVWDMGTAPSFRQVFDGLDWCGLTLVQAYSGVLNVGIAGCSDFKLRNLGTAAAPLDMGAPPAYGTWTRSTSTMTVTSTAHGLKTNDIIAVIACSDVAPKALTTTTATLWTVASAPTADAFTVTVTNTGQTTGQNLWYYPCKASVLVNFLAASACNPIKIQRCYVPHLRTGLLTTEDNTIKNVVLEDVWGTVWGVQLTPMLNCTTRRMQSTPALTAQTACYGTHWIDYYTTAQPTDIAGVSWSRTTTVGTVTSTASGLRAGDQISVTTTSDASAIPLGVKTLTQMTAVASPVNSRDTFQFTCLNAGGASGTLTFTPINGRIGLLMNEATVESAAQVTLSGGAAFTSAGSLYMPTIGQYAIFTSPKPLKGHSSFIIDVPVMAGGTIGNYDITYSLDGGSTWNNLYYPRAGGGGSSASQTVTMTSTTGVAANDYVTGTNIAPHAKVVSVDSSTNITVSIANTGTVSGVLVFNHLPYETIADPVVGIPLKIKITTSTTNSTAITSLYVKTNATTAARAATDSLDLAPVTLTNLVSGSDIVFLSSGTSTVIESTDQTAGTSYSTEIDPTVYPLIDICVYQPGYYPYIQRNLPLTADGISLPMNQQADTSYIN